MLTAAGLSAAEFNASMERVGRRIAELADEPDAPAAQAAAELLRTVGDLHAAGLARILAIIQAAGPSHRPLLEKFAQDDLIRSLLLCYDLHPIDLRTRLDEVVGNFRPVVESYGGSVAIADASPSRVVVRLRLDGVGKNSPADMIKTLLADAIVVAAPDVAEVRFQEGVRFPIIPLPIVSVK